LIEFFENFHHHTLDSPHNNANSRKFLVDDDSGNTELCIWANWSHIISQPINELRFPYHLKICPKIIICCLEILVILAMKLIQKMSNIILTLWIIKHTISKIYHSSIFESQILIESHTIKKNEQYTQYTIYKRWIPALSEQTHRTKPWERCFPLYNLSQSVSTYMGFKMFKFLNIILYLSLFWLLKYC
jgi:hypothetical protein